MLVARSGWGDAEGDPGIPTPSPARPGVCPHPEPGSRWPWESQARLFVPSTDKQDFKRNLGAQREAPGCSLKGWGRGGTGGFEDLQRVHWDPSGGGLRSQEAALVTP